MIKKPGESNNHTQGNGLKCRGVGGQKMKVLRNGQRRKKKKKIQSVWIRVSWSVTDSPFIN